MAGPGWITFSAKMMILNIITMYEIALHGRYSLSAKLCIFFY